MESCYCEGTEDFDCVGIKMNMEELCFSTKNEIDDSITKSSACVKEDYKMAMITLITAASLPLHWIWRKKLLYFDLFIIHSVFCEIIHSE